MGWHTAWHALHDVPSQRMRACIVLHRLFMVFLTRLHRLQAASESWKEEVLRNSASRTQLQRTSRPGALGPGTGMWHTISADRFALWVPSGAEAFSSPISSVERKHSSSRVVLYCFIFQSGMLEQWHVAVWSCVVPRAARSHFGFTRCYLSPPKRAEPAPRLPSS